MRDNLKGQRGDVNRRMRDNPKGQRGDVFRRMRDNTLAKKRQKNMQWSTQKTKD